MLSYNLLSLRMKVFLIIITQLICFIILTACQNEKPVKEIVEKFPDGKVKKEVFYLKQQDKKEPVKEIEYYSNGKIKLEGTYKNGKMHGKWKVYYENGMVWSEGEYVDGLREGYSKVYYPSGKLQFEGEYKKGQRTGTWKFYTPDGKVQKIVSFQ
ncbi:MAG: hypothetical protein KatS3mg034_1827 [Vicingaceae bacterium]|nr:MAG: hypothetical protein KatS3mg034_1827 [Vicingaceae bacterium]